MSRGLGRLQRAILALICDHGKPITFEEIRALVRKEAPNLPPDHWLWRSLRRALHRLVLDGELITLGEGGRADPQRYFFHPMVLYQVKDPVPRAAFDADPGAMVAEAKDKAKMVGLLAKMSAALEELKATKDPDP
jgi:hypothetical protein